MNIWQELGIEPTAEISQIKLAYAARLKQVHPEDDPEGFQRLRSAYETAQALAQNQHLPPLTISGGSITAPAPPPPAVTTVQPPPSAAPTAPAAPDPRRAAFTLIKSVLDTPAAQRQDAIGAALRQPGWEAIDFQLQLQRAVATNLFANFEQLRALIDDFAKYYGWSLNRVAIEQSDHVISELMARLDARDWRQYMETRLPNSPGDIAGALATLRRPPDDAAFNDYAREASHLESIRRVLRELQSVRPHVLRLETNQASVQWWANYLSPKVAAATPNPKRPVQPKKTGWSLDFRMLWFVLVLLGALGRCGSQLQNSSTNPAPSNSSSGLPQYLANAGLPPIATGLETPALPSTMRGASPAPKPPPNSRNPLWNSVQKLISGEIQYPTYAAANGHQGTATVRFELTASGHLVNPTLLHSSGYLELDDEAVDVFRRLAKASIDVPPSALRGHDRVVAQMPVNFTLDETHH